MNPDDKYGYDEHGRRVHKASRLPVEPPGGMIGELADEIEAEIERQRQDNPYEGIDPREAKAWADKSRLASRTVHGDGLAVRPMAKCKGDTMRPDGPPDGWTPNPGGSAVSAPFQRVATRSELEELRSRVRTLEIIVTCLTAESGLMESISNVDPMSKPHATEPSQEDGADPCGSKAEREV